MASEGIATEEAPATYQPGFHLGVDFDDYVAWNAANNSTLVTFSRTPAHVRYELDHGGKKPTPAKDLGWLLHQAVLEPERFERECIVPPKIGDKRYKQNKALWAEFTASHPGATFVDFDTMQKVKAMRANLYDHETAGPFLKAKGGFNEVSILWDDAATGVRCKARIDRVAPINEFPVIGDIKTAANAGREAFGRAMFNYGYDTQAVHYLDGLETLAPIPNGSPQRRMIFFVVENEPPHCVAVYEPDDATIEEGAIKRRRYLMKWKECHATGIWPSYPSGIDYCSLPAWAFRNWVDE